MVRWNEVGISQCSPYPGMRPRICGTYKCRAYPPQEVSDALVPYAPSQISFSNFVVPGRCSRYVNIQIESLRPVASLVVSTRTFPFRIGIVGMSPMLSCGAVGFTSGPRCWAASQQSPDTVVDVHTPTRDLRSPRERPPDHVSDVFPRPIRAPGSSSAHFSPW